MKYTKLGETDLKVSRIGFGCWAIGGSMWGEVKDTESIAAIHKALDLGINFFDTADTYGHGHSEEILRKALSDKKENVVIATKGGMDWGQFGDRFPRPDQPHYGMGGRKIEGLVRNCRPDYLQAAINASLKRLQRDYIDIYYIHWPDMIVPWEKTLEVLLKSQKEGKIRYIGVSNFSTEQAKEWLESGPIHVVQPLYHILDRRIEKDLLPFCREEGIAVVPYGTLAHGLLTGKFTEDTKFRQDDFRPSHPMFQGETYKKNLAIVEKLKKVAANKKVSPAQLAVSWVLSQPGITSTLVGAKRPSQVEENAAATDCELGEGELASIEKNLFEENRNHIKKDGGK